ncbi:hypothetical protein C2845_PM16G03480 [Panicum miliaceum]|uniref:Uncharacterized protein n=1 Tax=Panicum miliaceum TaxID=4540 RepID=A0A3L6PWI4_PANMI|nr:hypothetical protein C2845_PM16G03480 [Panicum miliaceum]
MALVAALQPPSRAPVPAPPRSPNHCAPPSPPLLAAFNLIRRWTKMGTTATRSTSRSLVPPPASICSLKRFSRIRPSSRSSNPHREAEVLPRGSHQCARLALLDLLEVAVEEVGLVSVSQDPWISELIHVDVVLADAAGMEQAPVDLVVDPCRTSRCSIWFG